MPEEHTGFRMSATMDAFGDEGPGRDQQVIASISSFHLIGIRLRRVMASLGPRRDPIFELTQAVRRGVLRCLEKLRSLA